MLASRATGGMVVAPHFAAAEAGRAILAEGGNAVEAAIAVASTIAVTYPHMNSIGGDGFWLIHRPGQAVTAIDACGRAAARADLALYQGMDVIPWRGPLAANTVAGAISGWAKALDLAPGHLPLARLLADAAAYAREGVTITAGGAANALAKGDELRSQPGAYAEIFEPEGRPLAQADLLRQPALARTLERLAADGLDSFYRGELARDIADDLALLGSPVSAQDLADHDAQETVPLSTRVSGATLFNHQPPTQGIASLLILALADRLDLGGESSFAHVHGLVEATKQAFLWRDLHCGDPAYMAADPRALLSDAEALDAMAARIDPTKALPWPQPSQQGDTVWFGAADKDGMVVSVIQSTYFEFGSGLVLPRTGITWQNRGASFRLAETGWNALKPGRKPFHTLNPAMALFDDARVMSYGTMGGEGQPQTQGAVFTRYARMGTPLAQAIAAPRWLLGRTWGEDSTSLKIEEGFASALYDELAAAGHKVERVAGNNSMMGHAGAIVVGQDANGAWYEGASDPRCDGRAAGL
ncbi:MAG: gamma-glutamyltransferase family protein [Sphingomonadales bacterium]|nr:gamma-glutamyltransferase family protein [Sphingomonadales bacterium]MDE2168115.1 gamma-glutamyltransferase family protein [Sphingomonadales bacterium]